MKTQPKLTQTRCQTSICSAEDSPAKVFLSLASEKDLKIRRGKISKLSVRLNAQTVIGYDRGWYKKPSTQEERVVLFIILNSLN